MLIPLALSLSDVYYLSDRLLPVRPIDAYLGEVNTTDKVVVIGSLRPATQRLAGSTSSEERRHGVVLSKLPGTLSPEVWHHPSPLPPHDLCHESNTCI